MRALLGSAGTEAVLQMLEVGAYLEVLLEASPLWEVWLQGLWRGRQGRRSLVPYPHGSAPVPVPELRRQTPSLGQGVSRQSEGPGGSQGSLPVQAPGLRGPTGDPPDQGEGEGLSLLFL